MREKSKERTDYIDIAKGIGIIFVIIGHSKIDENLYNFIYAFHMPLFFIISGYLYDSEKWKNLGFMTLINKRFKAYIIPYFVLCFINLFINIPYEFIKNIRGKELLVSTLRHIWYIFYSTSSAKTSPNCSPLWFLTCIFLANIYIYFIFKIKDKNIRIMILILATALCIFINKYVYLTTTLPTLPWHFDSALLGAVFMYIGYEIKKYNLLLDKSINMWGVIAAIIVGVYAIILNGPVNMNGPKVSNPILFYVGSIFISYALLYICANYIKHNKFLSYFGKNTILVMGFNYAINTYSRLIWKKVPILNNYNYT